MIGLADKNVDTGRRQSAFSRGAAQEGQGVAQTTAGRAEKMGEARPYVRPEAEVVEAKGDTAPADVDAADDQEWDRAFAASQETLARLAARSRAHREAGRTKKIGQ